MMFSITRSRVASLPADIQNNTCSHPELPARQPGVAAGASDFLKHGICFLLIELV
jgi:hypothetical protein